VEKAHGGVVQSLHTAGAFKRKVSFPQRSPHRQCGQQCPSLAHASLVPLALFPLGSWRAADAVLAWPRSHARRGAQTWPSSCACASARAAASAAALGSWRTWRRRMRPSWRSRSSAAARRCASWTGRPRRASSRSALCRRAAAAASRCARARAPRCARPGRGDGRASERGSELEGTRPRGRPAQARRWARAAAAPHARAAARRRRGGARARLLHLTPAQRRGAGGEVDVRGCYTALAVAHVLDLDVPGLAARSGAVDYVRRCQARSTLSGRPATPPRAAVLPRPRLGLAEAREFRPPQAMRSERPARRRDRIPVHAAARAGAGAWAAARRAAARRPTHELRQRAAPSDRRRRGDRTAADASRLTLYPNARRRTRAAWAASPATRRTAGTRSAAWPRRCWPAGRTRWTCRAWRTGPPAARRAPPALALAGLQGVALDLPRLAHWAACCQARAPCPGSAGVLGARAAQGRARRRA